MACHVRVRQVSHRALLVVATSDEAGVLDSRVINRVSLRLLRACPCVDRSLHASSATATEKLKTAGSRNVAFYFLTCVVSKLISSSQTVQRCVLEST